MLSPDFQLKKECLILFLEKDEMTECRPANRQSSKSLTSQSSIAVRSDHLTKLNLDIGSMVEVRHLAKHFALLSLKLKFLLEIDFS